MSRDVFVGYMHNGATAGAFTDSMVRMLLWDRDHDDRIADLIERLFRYESRDLGLG